MTVLEESSPRDAGKGIDMVQYLQTKIVDVKTTEIPRYGMSADGYTKRSGAPTSKMIKLEGEKIWRRLMYWQFSNASTCFVNINKQPFVVTDCEVPTPSSART